jgi:small subunit ribosomal protein S14
MAKKSVVLRNLKRQKIVNQQFEKRSNLKKLSLDPNTSEQERYEARVKLQKLPRNGSPIRLRNRCQITGRPRGVYRKFMISRIVLREYAHRGFIPGMVKSSW